MKSKVKLLEAAEKINKLAPEMGGVFSSADLSCIIGGGSDLVNFRTIRRLAGGGTIFRVQKGLYTAKKCDLWILASRISGNSYISMDSVLAKNGLIGTVPANSVSVIHLTHNRSVNSVCGDIYFHSISKKLFFGFDRIAGGIHVADSEKAFLDLLYYHTKGIRFAVDPLNEIIVQKLDKKKLASYLKKYNNPKFIKFVRGIVYEK